MIEFMVLLTMIRAEHGKPVPPKQPVAITGIESRKRIELTAIERAELRQAAENYARQATGNLIRDTESGLYVPEVTSAIARH